MKSQALYLFVVPPTNLSGSVISGPGRAKSERAIVPTVSNSGASWESRLLLGLGESLSALSRDPGGRDMALADVGRMRMCSVPRHRFEDGVWKGFSSVPMLWPFRPASAEETQAT